MQSLAEVQSGVRHAITTGEFAAITPLLIGGQTSEHRLAIHRRNYEASLITALLDKFPATTWLVGLEFIGEAAGSFVDKHPPCKPCIAEYGEDFPAFLAAWQGAFRIPYLREFSELEWRLTHVAIAVDEPALRIEKLSAIQADVLPDTALTLQSGLRYLRASWPVDDLMNVYLAETAPDRFEFDPADVFLEIIGARGEFRMNRCKQAEFIFRNSILKGHSIGEASLEAMNADPRFDPGGALAALVAAGLVTGITGAQRERKNHDK